LRKKIAICLGLLLAAFFLKFTLPGAGDRIGKWVSGAQDNRVSEAISGLISSLGDGERIDNAVEVFYETIKGQD
jgi:hypothetical protein